MEIKIQSLEDIASAAQKFVDEMGENCVFAFYGKMGAGKTTFIKAICEALGVKDVVASPTFAIVNEYADAAGQPVYHFDLVEELLPEDTVKVSVEVLEDESRRITLA